MLLKIYFILILLAVVNGNNHSSSHNTSFYSSDSHSRSSSHDNKENEGFQVFHIEWQRVSSPIIICAALLVASYCKIFFHMVHKYISKIPESCILICLGLVIGGVAYAIDDNNELTDLLFNPDVFFLYILPPIVMEAGYFMPKEPFFANLGTILTFAIFGTIFNTVAIGLSLYGVYEANLMPGMKALGGLTVLDSCLFGSIISAVDPVAVISVFEEIHVNIVLYICVFGESLLNDGVAVVLYKMFESFLQLRDGIGATEFGLAFLSFFVVAVGGLIIGILFGYLGAFTTKFTKNYHRIEATLVFLHCYISYLIAELFHLSGIIAIVFAGFTMSAYAQHNISSKSVTTIEYGLKMLANIAETLIFILLGISAVSDFWKYWNFAFTCWTLLFITIYRPIGVLALTFLANKFRLDKIDMVDQFVMAYGGLRGAIAFSLVSLTSVETVPAIKTMVCATIVVVYFTCFLQGSTIRPIVECLKVKTQEVHRKSMFEEINYRLIDHLMAGVEDIIGHHGHHYWHHKLITFHTQYISKHFIREPFSTQDQELLETFQNINKLEAENLVEELQKGTGGGNSSGQLAGQTFASLIMPKVTEVNSSYKIREQQNRNETYVDMNAIVDKGGQIVLEDTHFHHLLTENLYMPRRGALSKFHKSIQSDDTASRRQEQEILLRRKIHNESKRKFKKHHRTHKKPSKSHIPSDHHHSSRYSHRNNSKQLDTFGSPESNRNEVNEKSVLLPDETDQGITFQVNKETVETTQTTKLIEDGIDKTNNKVAMELQLPWKSADSSTAQPITKENPVAASWKPVSSDVALDRELPWKRGDNKYVAVNDPSLRTSSNLANEQMELDRKMSTSEQHTPQVRDARKSRHKKKSSDKIKEQFNDTKI